MLDVSFIKSWNIYLLAALIAMSHAFANDSEDKICIASKENKTIICIGDKVQFENRPGEKQNGIVLDINTKVDLAEIKSKSFKGRMSISELTLEKPCYKNFCTGDKVLFELFGKYRTGNIISFKDELITIKAPKWFGSKQHEDVFRVAGE